MKKIVLTPFVVLAAVFMTGCAATRSAATTAKAGTLLVIGNSLACHGASPSLGWEANHGMAASAVENDYAHLLLKKLNAATGREHRLFITGVVDEANIGTLPPALPETAAPSRVR